ncbi:hypothetical protein RI054_08g42690 [Pseudoscourfieldia marina]
MASSLPPNNTNDSSSSRPAAGPSFVGPIYKELLDAETERKKEEERRDLEVARQLQKEFDEEQLATTEQVVADAVYAKKVQAQAAAPGAGATGPKKKRKLESALPAPVASTSFAANCRVQPPRAAATAAIRLTSNAAPSTSAAVANVQPPRKRDSGGIAETFLGLEEPCANLRFVLLFENVVPHVNKNVELANFKGAMQGIAAVQLDSYPTYSCAMRKRIYICNLRGHISGPPKSDSPIYNALVRRRASELKALVLKYQGHLLDGAVPEWWPLQHLRCITTMLYQSAKTLRGVTAAPSRDALVDVGKKDRKRASDIIKEFSLVPSGIEVNNVVAAPSEMIEEVMGFPIGHSRFLGNNIARRQALGSAVDVTTLEYVLYPLPSASRILACKSVGVTVFSLCDGIGGIPLAIDNVLRNAGHFGISTLVTWEIGENASLCAKKWWETSGKPANKFVNLGDLRKERATTDDDRMLELCRKYGFPHVICGGPPCNNLSGNNRVQATSSVRGRTGTTCAASDSGLVNTMGHLVATAQRVAERMGIM